MKRSAYPLGFGLIQSMYSADKARGYCLDRPPDLRNRGFSEAVGSDIDLGRARMGGRRLFLMLRLGSPCGARAGSGAPMTGSTLPEFHYDRQPEKAFRYCAHPVDIQSHDLY